MPNTCNYPAAASVKRTLLFSGIIAMACLFLLFGAGSNPAIAQQAAAVEKSKNDAKEARTKAMGEQEKLLREKWGIEIRSLALTASNHMLDFRYLVVDVNKAAPLFKRDKKAFLLHQKSGKVVNVPVPAKIGPLRTTDPPQQGRIYWMFFGNPGMLIKHGDQVTVIIGDFRAENLEVI